MNELNDQAKILRIKVKMYNLLNEINNLKQYNNHIAENTEGEELDNYVDETSKEINKLQDELEALYRKIIALNNINKE